MGSTKVRTVPGLLARAVLQGEPAQPVSLAQSSPPAHHTPAFLPAGSMDVGLGGGGQVEVEHGTHVVEVDAPGHACLGIGGPVGTHNTQPRSPELLFSSLANRQGLQQGLHGATGLGYG